MRKDENSRREKIIIEDQSLKRSEVEIPKNNIYKLQDKKSIDLKASLARYK